MPPRNDGPGRGQPARRSRASQKQLHPRPQRGSGQNASGNAIDDQIGIADEIPRPPSAMTAAFFQSLHSQDGDHATSHTTYYQDHDVSPQSSHQYATTTHDAQPRFSRSRLHPSEAALQLSSLPFPFASFNPQHYLDFGTLDLPQQPSYGAFGYDVDASMLASLRPPAGLEFYDHPFYPTDLRTETPAVLDARPNYQAMPSSSSADGPSRYLTEMSSILGTPPMQAEAPGASASAAEPGSREQNIPQSRGRLNQALRATPSARFQPYQLGPALIPPPGVIAPLRAGEEYVGGRRQPVIMTIRHPTIHTSVRPVTRLPPTPPVPSARLNPPPSATTQSDNRSSSTAHAAAATEEQKQTDAAHYFVRNLLRDRAIVGSVELSALANAAFQEAELNRGSTHQATPAEINIIKKAGPNLRCTMRKNAEKCADFFDLRRPIAQEDSVTLQDWGARRLELLTGVTCMDFLHTMSHDGQTGYFECLAIENVLIDTLYRSSSIFSFNSPLRGFLDPMPCSSIALASILLLHFIRTFTSADHTSVEFKMASYVVDYDLLMALMDRISDGEEGRSASDRFQALRIGITRRGNEILSQQQLI